MSATHRRDARPEYTGEGLRRQQLPAAPWELARAWVDQAAAAVGVNPAVHEPTAMAVATIDADGRPDVREVLLRFFSPEGPGFVSSRWSTKAAQLTANPQVAASLTWSPLFRAIRFRGHAIELDPADLAAYWGERPWGARISAWASQQSHPIGGRAELETRVREYADRWPDQGQPTDVPVPQDWVGWRIIPSSVEFWAGRNDRLHDRFIAEKIGEGNLATDSAWKWERLQP